MNQHQLQEDLLQAWMSMEVCIRGNRLLSDLSMNEMLICNTLYQQKQGSPVTVTDLCSRTKLLKSQMNHILNSMESQGIVRRERGSHDKRVVFVYLQEAAIPRYLREHEHVLNIVGAVCSALGNDNAESLAALMEKAATVVSNIKEESECLSES